MYQVDSIEKHRGQVTHGGAGSWGAGTGPGLTASNAATVTEMYPQAAKERAKVPVCSRT